MQFVSELVDMKTFQEFYSLCHQGQVAKIVVNPLDFRSMLWLLIEHNTDNKEIPERGDTNPETIPMESNEEIQCRTISAYDGAGVLIDTFSFPVGR